MSMPRVNDRVRSRETMTGQEIRYRKYALTHTGDLGRLIGRVVDAGLTSEFVTVRPESDWPLAHYGDVLVKHGTLEVIE